MSPPDAERLVGIEASSIVGPRTGIGHATTELIEALLRRWPADWAAPQVWINSPRHPVPPEAIAWRDRAVPVRHTRWPGKVLLRSWQHAHWPPVERFTGPVQLFHSPASYIPCVRAARRIVTVHDVYFQHAPAHVEPYGGGYFAKTFQRLRDVDQVIAVSEFTRRELQHFYGLADDRITVVPQGVNPARFSMEATAQDAAILEQLKVERPYLLCVATIEPRKNLVTLIEGFARARQILRAAHQRAPQLVIVGLAGWGMKALRERLEQDRLDSPDQVRLAGYVPDAALPVLYRHALGFVFPSLYEGFGMPVLEAMASGCPVLCAEAGALPEVAAEAAAYFNPRDSNALARSIVRFMAEPHLREHLRTAGLQRARQFSWEGTAQRTLEVYARVLDRPR